METVTSVSLMRPGLLRAASRILKARRTLTRIADLSDAETPETLAEAYRLQHLVIERWSDHIAGWKIGATSRDVQEIFGVSQPVYGPVFKKDVYASPAHLSAGHFHHTMLEAEFVFTFATEMPSRREPYTVEEIAGALATVSPAFEIVSPRFTRLTVDRIRQLVADFCANGGAVLGASNHDWRTRDIAAHEVTLSVGGIVKRRGSGAAVLGNPLNALEWFVNARCRQGLRIAAGQFVMTGTVTGIHAVKPDEKALADFGSLGIVEVSFS